MHFKDEHKIKIEGINGNRPVRMMEDDRTKTGGKLDRERGAGVGNSVATFKTNECAFARYIRTDNKYNHFKYIVEYLNHGGG